MRRNFFDQAVVRLKILLELARIILILNLNYKNFLGEFKDMGNKLFGTDGVRGIANIFPMTAEFAMKLAEASAQLICTDKRRVAIGKDTRISGDMLEAAMIAGFTSQGVDVIKLGVIPTPAVTMLTPSLDVDMSVMITASHNPYHDNGIKLIAADGDKFSDEVTAALETKISAGEFVADANLIGRVTEDKDAVQKYIAVAKSTVKGEKPLKGLKVVLDCANGAFSNILPQVYKDLGAEVIVRAAEPDGKNINFDCGSMHPEKMMELVKERHADLGIAVDGDGDRIIVSDEKGNKIKSEQVIGFLAQYLDEEGLLKGRAVVSTVLSNTALERFIAKKGWPYYSTPVGERHVIAKMKEVGGVVGGEESGHLVVLDYCKSGDALVVSLLLAAGLLKSGKKMSDIFPVFELDPFVFVNPRFESREQVKALVKEASVIKVIEDCKARIEGKGRVFVHPSGTEPLIRVWVSGNDATLVQELNDKMVAAIQAAAQK